MAVFIEAVLHTMLSIQVRKTINGLETRYLPSLLVGIIALRGMFSLKKTKSLGAAGISQ